MCVWLIKPSKCIYSSISNLRLQLIQNQNKGRESGVIPVIPCCAIRGGQRTTKSGIRKKFSSIFKGDIYSSHAELSYKIFYVPR